MQANSQRMLHAMGNHVMSGAVSTAGISITAAPSTLLTIVPRVAVSVVPRHLPITQMPGAYSCHSPNVYLFYRSCRIRSQAIFSWTLSKVSEFYKILLLQSWSLKEVAPVWNRAESCPHMKMFSVLAASVGFLDSSSKFNILDVKGMWRRCEGDVKKIESSCQTLGILETILLFPELIGCPFLCVLS